MQVRSALMEERERLFAVLQQFDFLEPYPSQANFILCSVRATITLSGLPAQRWNARTGDAGILTT